MALALRCRRPRLQGSIRRCGINRLIVLKPCDCPDPPPDSLSGKGGSGRHGQPGCRGTGTNGLSRRLCSFGNEVKRRSSEPGVSRSVYTGPASPGSPRSWWPGPGLRPGSSFPCAVNTFLTRHCRALSLDSKPHFSGRSSGWRCDPRALGMSSQRGARRGGSISSS